MIGGRRTYVLRFEIVGSLERLTAAGLTPGQVFLPKAPLMRLSPVTVSMGEATNIGELRIKVSYDMATGSGL